MLLSAFRENKIKWRNVCAGVHISVVLFNNMFEVKHKLEVCLEIEKSVYAVQRI